MDITIASPSRGRPDSLRRAFDSFRLKESGKHNVEYLVGLDADDPALSEYYRALYGFNVKYIVEPRVSTSLNVNNLIACSKGYVIGTPMDDSVMDTEGWDEIIAQTFSSPLVGIGSALCEIHFITRWLYDLVGYFLHPEIEHYYNVNLILQVATDAGVIVQLPLDGRHLHVDDELAKYHARDRHKYIHQDSARFARTGDERLELTERVRKYKEEYEQRG